MKKFIFYFFITVVALVFLLPLFWMINSSFKIDEVIYQDMTTIFAFIPKFSDMSLKSYKELLSMYHILKNISNSFYYAVLTVFIGLLINSMAGYALAAFNFPFKDGILLLVIALMIVPIEATILPLFLVVRGLNLNNTTLGLILPFATSVMNIFLFRQYFLSYPKELTEASKIDGLGNIGTFFKIVMPSSKSMYITVGILAFLASWNDFLWPVMVLTDSNKMPVQVALNAIFSDKYNISTSHIMAALTLVTIPVIIVYIIFQNYIVEGSLQSGIK